MARWRNKGAPIPHDGGFIDRGAEFDADDSAQVVRQWRNSLLRLEDPEPDAPGADSDTPDGSE